MTNYGMTNVEIKKEVHSGFTCWMVYADTERFGKHEIMAQCISKKEAEKWCEENGVEQKTAADLFREQIEKHGKVQIGNAMFRRLYEEKGRFYGFGGYYRCFEDLTKEIENCKMEKFGRTGKTQYGRMNRTVKFGNDCTW